MAFKIQNYLIIFLVLVACNNAYDTSNYAAIIDSPPLELVGTSENKSGIEAFIVPREVINAANKEENANEIFFIDLKIAQKWTPDSSLSQDLIKKYLAFHMIDNIYLIGSDTLRPLFGHFEDLFGIREFNVLHLAFPNSARTYKDIILLHDNPLWPDDKIKLCFNKDVIKNS